MSLEDAVVPDDAVEVARARADKIRQLLSALSDAEAAGELTERIRVALDDAWELITEAYTTRAWAALGYDSWDAYVVAEFGASRLRVPREDRTDVVASMREAGMSIRAIASATGVSVGTVHSDLAGVQNRTPEGGDGGAKEEESWGTVPNFPWEPSRIVGTDGKSYSAESPRPSTPGAPTRRRGSNLWHLNRLDRATTMLGGMGSVLENIQELDGTVSPEDAATLSDTLTAAIRDLQRVNRLLKERASMVVAD